MKPDSYDLKRKIGVVLQNVAVFDELTVRENIEVGAYLSKKPLDIDEIIEVLGLKEHQNKIPSQLSGGQQQRVLLARALCATRKARLLDEPVAGLDPYAQEQLYALIYKINKEEKTTIIMVSHDLEAAKKYATHILHIGKEKCVFCTKHEFLKENGGCLF